MRMASALFNWRQLRWLAWLPLVFAIAIQSACATSPSLVNHSFRYGASSDSPDIIILDYRYGSSTMTRAKEWQKREAYLGTIQGGGVSGPMLRGDDLYVKWRVKSTGEIFEDTVDLKDRLPSEITSHTIYFIIKGPQLHVYLITPEKLLPNPCPPPERRRLLMSPDVPNNRIFALYCSTRIIRIYPGQPEPLDIR